LIPLVVMVGIWIMQDRIKTFDFNKKGQLAFAGNRNFFIGLAISCLAATTGIYYAFYSCVIFIFSWFLCGLKKGKFFDKNSFCAVIFCLVILSLLLYLYLPAILYWIDFGHNSDVAKRNVADSEFFALKIINLFVPVANHYFDYLKNIRELFDAFASEQENFATSLGILAASGFLFLLLWLLARNFSEEKSVFAKTIKKFSLQKNHQDLISNLAGLNLLSILFATVGGLVMFVAVAFPLLRSHARFSIFIAFFSLFLVAIIFDRIIEKKIFKQKIFAQIFVLFIFVMALFDQVGRVSAATIQTEKMKRKFRNDQEFVQKIEKSLPEKSQIFVLPVISFPEGSDDYDLLSAYLHSKNLRWSYPSIAGRESNLWQKKIIKLDFKDFVFELKKAGFSGIYIDRMQMTQYALEKEKPKAWHDLRKIESKLKSLKKPVLTSDDLRLVFFEI
jgi:phosphoglycerol transferase